MLLASLGSRKSGEQTALCLGLPKTGEITLYHKATNETRRLFGGFPSFLSSFVLVLTTIIFDFSHGIEAFSSARIRQKIKYIRKKVNGKESVQTQS